MLVVEWLAGLSRGEEIVVACVFWAFVTTMTVLWVRDLVKVFRSCR